ncbi:MAG: molybdate ABC transporter substrate-binding protein [Myxococcales bacterium]
MKSLAGLGWSLLLLACACGPKAAEPGAPAPDASIPKVAAPAEVPVIQVAAASDLTPALQAMAPEFERATGKKVSLTFAATGILAKQIAEGAPFDVFAAANESFVDQVIEKGACDASTKAPYSEGRLVLWQRKDVQDPLPDWPALKNAKYKHIAIANPEHAPYGKAAKQTLEKLDLWQAVESRIVYGENVKQTMQFAESGNAELAFVGLSLALASDGNYREVSPELHQPIKQTIVVCKNGKAQAAGKLFAEYLNSPEGRRVLNAHGILFPHESLAGSDKKPDAAAPK